MAYHYIRLFAVVSTAVFATIIGIYLAVVFTVGQPAKLPKAIVLMSQDTYQGFHCGWFKSAPKDWTKCRD